MGFRQITEQLIRIDPTFRFQNGHLLRCVFQLTDVARPRIIFQDLNRIRRQRQRRHLISLRKVGGEFAEQQMNIG